jgi:hypothetical protein
MSVIYFSDFWSKYPNRQPKVLSKKIRSALAGGRVLRALKILPKTGFFDFTLIAPSQNE